MNSIVSQYLKNKGKQLRPILALISGKMMGGINQNVITAGAAIEILHNASLIHDDVIDQSKQRRGASTINHVWDNHVAVLVGGEVVEQGTTHDVFQNPRHKVTKALLGKGDWNA
jgi:octaprenyl-diphosphate synthase